ncbi:MAG TPA: hypothetical protein VJ302_14845 [Blastocatellia bacterium]|nr:hypothetical protein [Blastocatellia bacterium]
MLATRRVAANAALKPMTTPTPTNSIAPRHPGPPVLFRLQFQMELHLLMDGHSLLLAEAIRTAERISDDSSQAAALSAIAASIAKLAAAR